MRGSLRNRALTLLPPDLRLTPFRASAVSLFPISCPMQSPSMVVPLAFFYGGLAQFVAGLWEYTLSNTFGATGE